MGDNGSKRVERRRTQLLDDLRNRRYWELKKKPKDIYIKKKEMKTTVYQSNISYVP